ncbi:MAG: heat-inducible transcriptional repressor HrcA [Armatimonadota bacterium]|nr:heat-inducible transcriptional repressor HrcA [Armatimonadota bacterium]
MTLRPRQQALLAAAIERYVETAEPVGSATLASDPKFIARFGNVSSATVRNELAELEEIGLLAHPHTSAGRVPTDAGYRYYVNEVLHPRPVRPDERAHIRAGIAAPPASVEDALREATAALAKLTGYPAVASLPPTRSDRMRHVQINPVPPHRLILILVTAAGRIEHRIFEVEHDVPASRLTTVVNFLNEQLGGRPLATLRTLRFEDVAHGLHDAETLALARRAWDLVRQSVHDLGDDLIVVQGLITLLNEPEFSDIEQARAAMRLFENTDVMSDLLRAPQELEVRSADQAMRYAVVIGHEHQVENPAVERFSLVGIAYGAGGEVLGSVGVMGPTRMKYAEAISLLPALAARLQVCLEAL